MLTFKGKLRLAVALAAIIQAALLGGTAPPARAAGEDVAMFYDSLEPYGSWVDYGNYGPVWYPTRVSSNWRPYVDGRWAPSSGGWAFETSEPWGWATYHYGNWMPTTEYGWVWSPGSTWYPSTAAWRTSDYYMGWAPIPPPNYVPEPAFSPPGGYYPGTPILDLITAPFWIFAQAASFLLGFGQPFLPIYSYYNCGCLAPYNYGPVVYGATFPLTDFYYPGYAASAYYCFGPPFPFVSRVTNVNIGEINNYVDRVNFRHMHNVLPPEGVMNRHPYLREAIPASVREGRPLEIHRVADNNLAERELNRPGVMSPPANVPRLTREIPKTMVAPGAERLGRAGLQGVRGMGLPAQAQRTETSQMRQQIRLERQLRPQGRALQRLETRPEFRPPSGRFVTPSGEAAPVPSREFHAAAPREFRTATPGFQAAPRREFRVPSAEFTRRAPQPEFRGIPQREFRAPSMPREFRAAPQARFRSAPAPRYTAPRQAPSRGGRGEHR
jgi:hypothetical protein